MKTTFTITIKPTDPKADLIFFEVPAKDARDIQTRWDAHQNIQIGDSYISWQRVVEITAPPRTNLLDRPLWCGHCENGWKFNPRGAYPCSTCNLRGVELVNEYFDDLAKQPSGVRALELEALYAQPGYWEAYAAKIQADKKVTPSHETK